LGRALIQFIDETGRRALAYRDGEGSTRQVEGCKSVFELVQAALSDPAGLVETAETRLAGPVDLVEAERSGRLLPALDHPDPAHLYVTGTGLTHLGSAEGRDKMHQAAQKAETDSMRMFKLGLDGGRPLPGSSGAQPEWFYKGDGSCLVGTGMPLVQPGFALDGGEEPEIAGAYVIDRDSQPRRLGYVLANEFSDHLTERQNYLYLAHSKLRQAAIGPELLLDRLPDHVEGQVRIRRGGATLWEQRFVSGEANMCHSLANLEHHHFKYALFRRPLDLHIHFFGAAALSFSDGVKVEDGDEFEIAADPFAFALRNRVTLAPAEPVVEVRAL